MLEENILERCFSPVSRLRDACLQTFVSCPQGRCTRENCKYLHPPAHLKTQLEINGRNNLIQQKTAAAMLAQQMQFMIPGTTMQHVVSVALGNTATSRMTLQEKKKILLGAAASSV